MIWKEITIEKQQQRFLQLHAKQGAAVKSVSYRMGKGESLESVRLAMRSFVLKVDPVARITI